MGPYGPPKQFVQINLMFLRNQTSNTSEIIKLCQIWTKKMKSYFYGSFEKIMKDSSATSI